MAQPVSVDDLQQCAGPMFVQHGQHLKITAQGNAWLTALQPVDGLQTDARTGGEFAGVVGDRPERLLGW